MSYLMLHVIMLRFNYNTTYSLSGVRFGIIVREMYDTYLIMRESELNQCVNNVSRVE